ncbi:MAG: VOC family protein [Halanaerobiales bacterium]
MKYKCALFVVDDIEEAKDFYVRLLGQKIKYDFGENVTFEGDFALHEKEHFQSLLGEHEIKNNANCSELYFEDNDLKQLEEKLIQENVEFVHKVREQPWRQRVMRIYGPSKNIIEIGESLEYLAYRLRNEGKSEEEIGQITNMDKNFVKKAVKKFNQVKKDIYVYK